METLSRSYLHIYHCSVVLVTSLTLTIHRNQSSVRLVTQFTNSLSYLIVSTIETLRLEPPTLDLHTARSTKFVRTAEQLIKLYKEDIKYRQACGRSIHTTVHAVRDVCKHRLNMG